MNPTLSDTTAQALAAVLSRHGMDLLAGALRGSQAARHTVVAAVQQHTGIDLHRAADGSLSPEQWRQLKAFELNEQDLLLGLQVGEAPVAAAAGPEAAPATWRVQSTNDGGAGCFAALAAFAVLVGTFVFAFYAAFRRPAEAGSTELIYLVLGFLLGLSVMALQHLFGAARRGGDARTKELP